MPTGDTYVNLALKRFLSQNRMSANFLDYTVAMTQDGLSRIFPTSGLFTFPVPIVQNGAASTFDLNGGSDIEGIDNQGRVLILTGASRLTNIPYENTAGDHYWLGMKYIAIPEGIYTNPRTGVVEYDLGKEEVGEYNLPTSVVDNGNGTFTANVNSLFPDGASHAGRTVKVALINPISIDESVAIEDLTVVYGGGNNTITSTGDLGQTTISTNVADYLVMCIGVSVYNAGVAPQPNPFSSDYITLGNITGGNPGANDNGDQIDLSGGGGHSLQHAYDGASGSGSGRMITISSGPDEAVEIRKTSTAARSHDIYNASIRVRTDIPTGLPGVGYGTDRAIDITSRYVSGDDISCRVGIADFTGGDKLRIEETVNVSGSTVTFTRGGSLDLDLTGNVAEIVTTLDLIEISGSALGNDGVYIINAVPTSATMTIAESDGSPAALSAESGLSARVYRNFISVHNFETTAIFVHGLNDFYEDAHSSPVGSTGAMLELFVPTNTDDSDIIFRQYRDGSSEVKFDANGWGYFENIEATLDVEAGNDLTAGADVNATSGTGYFNNIDVTIDIDVGSDITAGIDITAGGNITTGNDFIYDGGSTFEMRLGPEDGNSEFYTSGDTGDDYPYWPVSFNGDLFKLESNASGKKCGFPLRLPHGCVLNRVRALVQPGSTGTVNLEIFKTNHDYSTPAIDNPPSSLGDDDSDGTTSLQVLDVNTISETISNTTNRYYIVLTSGNSGDDLWDIRINFTVTNFRPMAA